MSDESSNEFESDARDFRSGDVVRLRSGGPDMTIESFEVDDEGAVAVEDGSPLEVRTAKCVWFDQAPGGAWFGFRREEIDVDVLVPSPAFSAS